MTTTGKDDVEDAMLMALADGELPEAEARALAARIAASPALAERFALFAETAAQLREAWADDPIPEAWVGMIRDAGKDAQDGAGAANVVAFPPAHRRWALPSAPQMALAACLALGIGLGGFWLGRSGAPGVGDMNAGPLAAAERLAQTVTGGQTDLPDGSRARVLASFATDLGLCRLLSVETAGAEAMERAIACRDGQGWRIALAVSTLGEGSFVPASDMATGLVDDFLTDIGAGAPLDPEAERAALD
ncbi:hypothetical protein E7811_03180 [Aliigemmobacter aestuarii]|uniref:Anti-sigma factor n=1 Tax=Aliigemmobacter aestuarii TaxID=1445661 RepID=A0A4S3MQQ4_9RHOB|nr:hypothetical protein [Gemmobacter aestuarii]THD84747.1 hypothetical protein E7811_03180 [Gemmobacter aestuarii]